MRTAIVVPFPAGGIADSSVRLIAAKVAESAGQRVLVDNRGGEGGQIGASAVKSASPTATRCFSPTSARTRSIEGGLPIIVDGKQIGSIGVSGGSSAQDDQIGKAGLAALKTN